MQNNQFLLLKKFKNTESAQLCVCLAFTCWEGARSALASPALRGSVEVSSSVEQGPRLHVQSCKALSLSRFVLEEKLKTYILYNMHAALPTRR